jgi:hypothetical protein
MDDLKFSEQWVFGMFSYGQSPVKSVDVLEACMASRACWLFYHGFLLGILFDPENGSGMISKRSVDVHWTTWHYILKNSTHI